MRAISRISLTALSETVGVTLGAVSGFLIVHQLPKDTYARYSFIVVCITFLVGLSDIGLSHCYLPLVGDRTGEEAWVLGVCQRLYRLRWRFFMPAMVVVLVYWGFASLEHGWTDGQFLIASILAAASVLLAIREQSLRSLLIVLRQVTRLNRMTVVASIGRLLFVTTVLLLVPAQLALAGLLAATALGSIGALWQLAGMPQVSQFNHATLDPSEAVVIDQRARNILRPLILPMTFYQVQGLITVFLVSLFGLTSSIAEVAALTRPTLVLAILDRVLGVLLFPAIASAARGPTLHRLVLRSQGAYLAVMLMILASSFWRPDLWMILIGRQYLPQQGLLWMAFLSAVLMYSAGFGLSTLTSRGKTSSQVYLIPLVLIVQAVFLATLGINTTRAALLFSISTSATFFFFQYGLLATRWLHSQRAALEESA
jgi:hypothetical protein